MKNARRGPGGGENPVETVNEDLVGTANAVDTHTGYLGATIYAARAAAGLAAKYYDLQGRRLSQPSRAGVYYNGVVKVNK